MSNIYGIDYVCTEDTMDRFTFLHGIKLYLDKYVKDNEFLKNSYFFMDSCPIHVSEIS